MSHLYKPLVFVLLGVLLFSGHARAQENGYWSPHGDEGWTLQTYVTSLADTPDREATRIADDKLDMVVLPLFAGDGTNNHLSADQIARYHALGVRVICTVIAGYWDRSSPDADQFTPSMIGRSIWDQNRRWLDIRNSGVRTLMDARLAHAADIGCDGIDATYMELWYQNTGFFISYGDQLAYNRYLADRAHFHGLSIGLHNTTQQIVDLVGWYDFAIAEGCLEAAECEVYSPFRSLDKPVFQLEYDAISSEIDICKASRTLGYNTIVKQKGRDNWSWRCSR